jgi:dTDP-4-dehydrorhamnose reductase
MKSALVVGASGFVGRALLSHLGPERGVGTWHSKPAEGLVRFDAVTERLSDLRRLPSDLTHVFVPFGLVNPEACARDPEGTAKINVDSVIRLLEDAMATGLVPIFVSTDYVYDGSRGMRTEDEAQSPNTEYGRQKVAVERWLQSRAEPWLIARLSKVVSGDTTTHSVLGQWVNDIRTGNRMRSATDQVFSPAYVDDLAIAMIRLAEAGARGIFHVAGPEAMSRYDLNMLLVEAVRSVDPKVTSVVQPCSLRDIPFAEERPLNTSLSTAKLESVVEWRFRSMMEVCRKVAEMEFASDGQDKQER